MCGETYPNASLFQQAMAVSSEATGAERNVSPGYLADVVNAVASSHYGGSAVHYPNAHYATGKRFIRDDTFFYSQSNKSPEIPMSILRVITVYSHFQKLLLHNAFRKHSLMSSGRHFSQGGQTKDPLSFSAHSDFLKNLYVYSRGLSDPLVKKFNGLDFEFNFFILAPSKAPEETLDVQDGAWILRYIDLLLLQDSEGLTPDLKGGNRAPLFTPTAVFQPGLLVEFAKAVLHNVIYNNIYPSSNRDKVQPLSEHDKLTTYAKNLLGDAPHNKERQNLRGPAFILSKDGKNVFFFPSTLSKAFPKKWKDRLLPWAPQPAPDFIAYLHRGPWHSVLGKNAAPEVDPGEFLPGSEARLKMGIFHSFVERLDRGTRGSKKFFFRVIFQFSDFHVPLIATLIFHDSKV